MQLRGAQMVKSVVLDAMIGRSDFATTATPLEFVDQVPSLSIENLSGTGLLASQLRKPDFQRETNQWTPHQIVSFLESFLENELIPSVILWKSDSYVFVIDGGHRLSTLIAWINDDYGDGKKSKPYFQENISNEQRRIADRTRKLIRDRIGTYESVKEALLKDGFDPNTVRRARNMASRAIHLQWVSGDAEKAESSFFNINTKGTPLDEIEENLLRRRKHASAIAARSIARAATGHKYWSKFERSKIEVIEEYAGKNYSLLFSPEVSHPIKTLDLPLGQNSSPIHALQLLIEIIDICAASETGDKEPDTTGDKTIESLKACYRVLSRITGNEPGSLGLHPAIYFYSERGRNIPDLLLGMIRLIKRHVESKGDGFFDLFTNNRNAIESNLISKKNIISQALQIAGSKSRIAKAEAIFEFLLDMAEKREPVSDESIIQIVKPNADAKLLAVGHQKSSTGFSSETKSEIYIKATIDDSPKCSICGGRISVGKSVSFDHSLRKREGGGNHANNGQLAHPYCNTGFKS